MRNTNKEMKNNISRSLLMYIAFALILLFLLIIFASDVHVSKFTREYYHQQELKARNAAAAEKKEKKQIEKESKLTIDNQKAYVVEELSFIDGNTVRIKQKRVKGTKEYPLLMTRCPVWNEELNNEAVAALDISSKQKNLYFTFDDNSDEQNEIHLYYVEEDDKEIEYKPVSLILVESGLAITNTELNGGERNFDMFLAAEEDAKNERRGVWGIPDMVTSRGLNKP